MDFADIDLLGIQTAELDQQYTSVSLEHMCYAGQSGSNHWCSTSTADLHIFIPIHIHSLNNNIASHTHHLYPLRFKTFWTSDPCSCLSQRQIRHGHSALQNAQGSYGPCLIHFDDVHLDEWPRRGFYYTEQLPRKEENIYSCEKYQKERKKKREERNIVNHIWGLVNCIPVCV